jgi:hypothetical protein
MIYKTIPVMLLALAGLWPRTSMHAVEIDYTNPDYATMFFPTEETERLARLTAGGLMELVPVVVPDTSLKYKHLGWPVATRDPDTGRIIVMFRHQIGHGNATVDPGDDQALLGRRIIYTDDLVTWLPANPLDNASGARIEDSRSMHALGVIKPAGSSAYRIIMAKGNGGGRREFRVSDDQAVTWTANRPIAPGYTAAITPNIGPNLITHPVFGLIGDFGQESFYDNISESDLLDPERRRNFLARTRDGENWDWLVWKNPDRQRAVEPTLATWGPGHIVRINREWSSYGYGDDPSRKYFYLTQQVYEYKEGDEFEDIKFRLACTNISGNGAAGGPVERVEKPGRAANDTPEVIYNPANGRIEVIQSHRWGGGGLKTGHALLEDPELQRNTLNLWSIAADELLAGGAVWRFDGTLLERYGYPATYGGSKETKDGFHPGGSVVDAQRNRHHIFIYAGTRSREKGAAVYRCGRTLNTDAWREAIGAPEVTGFHLTGEPGRTELRFGEEVTITGARFEEGGEVYFNGVPSPSVVFVSATEARAIVPYSVKSGGRVTVRNFAADGESAEKFTLMAAIQNIGGLAIPEALHGQSVTLTAPVAAYPEVASYKWEVLGGDGRWQAIEDAGIYSGAGTGELRIRAASILMSNYKYRYTAVNAAGSVTGEAVLVVRPTPLSAPASLVVDGASGDLYVADAGRHALYKITAGGGTIGVFAGAAGVSGTAGASGTAARFNAPSGIAINSAMNAFVVADSDNSALRTVGANAATGYFAGSPGNPGHADGPGLDARFNLPVGVAVDNAGNTYVADSANHVIRMVTSSGSVSTIAGMPGVSGTLGGRGTAARFNYPTGLADGGSHLYVADTGNHVIRRIGLTGGNYNVTLFAGQMGARGCSDGEALGGARFNAPRGLVVDGGMVYVADTGNSQVREINADGLVSTIAGHPGDDGLPDDEGGETDGGRTPVEPIPGVPGFQDGHGAGAWLRYPEGIAMGNDGALYVADTGNAAIRKIADDPGKTVTTLTPLPPRPDPEQEPPDAGNSQPSVTSGGGGGAPSWWFVFGVAALGAIHYRPWRRLCAVSPCELIKRKTR